LSPKGPVTVIESPGATETRYSLNAPPSSGSYPIVSSNVSSVSGEETV
jgi:hypothetical protein